MEQYNPLCFQLIQSYLSINNLPYFTDDKLIQIVYKGEKHTARIFSPCHSSFKAWPLVGPIKDRKPVYFKYHTNTQCITNGRQTYVLEREGWELIMRRFLACRTYIQEELNNYMADDLSSITNDYIECNFYNLLFNKT